ncbi:LytR/AlgR family response regulator transcription factor [Pedobacter sp. KBS0701]|uniref:LytR/AlgR family response regulator transcription factor n=1 Tax=unclassified Pedobacter TaxID=2628915 RepID=UPI00110E78B8|nr:LytTR family DNA-binding domain-containing protein [Pedobacter sp. KBS0701]QDW24608.1 response regulator transcription factor [Pedobacter sp. KBS0701]
MSISCIAIDDDPHSLESLMAYMEKLPDLKLIQVFTEPLQALTEISVSNPVDIIFMDIEMPSLSGIELATLLRQKTTYLVFTTAHPRYAIDAFKVEADAYLLKPYSILHLAKTINNLYPTGKKAKHPFSILDDHFFYIPLHGENSDLVRIDLNELIAVEEIGDDIEFKTTKNAFLSSKSNFTKTLKMLKEHPAFIQVTPSVVIAKQHIKSVLNHKILLSAEVSINISESYAELFENFIKNNLQQEKPRPDAII